MRSSASDSPFKALTTHPLKTLGLNPPLWCTHISYKVGVEVVQEQQMLNIMINVFVISAQWTDWREGGGGGKSDAPPLNRGAEDLAWLHKALVARFPGNKTT